MAVPAVRGGLVVCTAIKARRTSKYNKDPYKKRRALRGVKTTNGRTTTAEELSRKRPEQDRCRRKGGDEHMGVAGSRGGVQKGDSGRKGKNPSKRSGVVEGALRRWREEPPNPELEGRMFLSGKREWTLPDTCDDPRCLKKGTPDMGGGKSEDWKSHDYKKKLGNYCAKEGSIFKQSLGGRKGGR